MRSGTKLNGCLVACTLALAATDAMAVPMTTVVESNPTPTTALPTDWDTSTTPGLTALTIAKFDNTPGGTFAGATLDSVQLDFTGWAGMWYYVLSSDTSGDPPASGSIFQKLDLILTGTGLDPSGLLNHQEVLHNIPTPAPNIASFNTNSNFNGPEILTEQVVSITINNILSNFEGNGILTFDVKADGDTDTSALTGGFLQGGGIDAQARMRATYFYTPASSGGGGGGGGTVPAPGALLLVGTGLLVLGAARHRVK
ncbi:MAG: hypothetical protein KDI83_00135 [Gammaproteobacteria bacterium]|nr:hypothetical protein [Gammaproteobacteria bacterium]